MMPTEARLKAVTSVPPPSHIKGINTTRRRLECLQVGRILCGRYRLEADVGTGAMGKVYQAMDLNRRQRCAIKLVRQNVDDRLQAHARFAHEARVSALLNHPNIVSVSEFNRDADGTEFLVLELLEGMDLQEHLSMYGRMPLRRALDVLRGVGSALQYAHDLGIVHHDIKPENIFLCRQRNIFGQVSQTVKVLDFGLARLLGDAPADPRPRGERRAESSLQGGQGVALGTANYLPPENLRENPTVDVRADQWSLAVVAYQLLSGQLPFDHRDPEQLYSLISAGEPRPLSQLVPQLPEPIERAIATALSKDPGSRFPKIGLFVRALDSADSASLEVGNLTRPPPAESGGDTLGSVHSALSSENATWVHQEDLAAGESASATQATADVHQTVQYGAAELLMLASQSLAAAANVPQVITENSSTKPYVQITEEQVVEERIVAPPLPTPALAPAPATSAQSLASTPGPCATVVLPAAQPATVVAPAASAPAATPASFLAGFGAVADTSALLAPLVATVRARRRRSSAIPWVGIGAGSALFCLGFLVALMWSARHTHPQRSAVGGAASLRVAAAVLQPQAVLPGL